MTNRKSNDVTLETLNKAKEYLKEIDFTEQARYITEVSQEQDAESKVKRILPNIYVMGFNDAILDNGGHNGSSKKQTNRKGI